MRLSTSLLDRLMDDKPDLSRDPPSTRPDELRAIRNGFRRDLEALLNTRRLCRTLPAAFGEISTALPSFGVEDFVGAPITTPEQKQALARSIEATIRTFEPRFLSVQVTLLGARDPFERRQNIRIEAVARLDHGPEPVVFETALDPTTRTFQIE
jgi:type VI secretion system protein ImpF